MNLFRHAKDGGLDRQYLRICAVYRMMAAGKLAKDRAIELLEQRGVTKAQQTIEVWSFKSARRAA